MTEQEKIAFRYNGIRDSLNQKTRRLFAGAEALAAGYGGVKLVEEATGISHGTIIKGKNELISNDQIIKNNRIRREGGGRKKIFTQKIIQSLIFKKIFMHKMYLIFTKIAPILFDKLNIFLINKYFLLSKF